jgi:hypothetical protein
MMRNSENMGIGILSQYISLSEKLEPEFKSNDKTPSWDGEIRVYKKNGFKKIDLEGKINVQVKTNRVKNLEKISNNIPVDPTDLRIYYKDGGVFYFVIFYKQREHVILYKRLLPSDIRPLLSIRHPKVTLNRINEDDIQFFETECENFLIHRTLQYSTKDYVLSIKDSGEVFTKFVTNGVPIDDYVLSHPLLFYKKQGNFSCFIGNQIVTEVSRIAAVSISCNGRCYFPEYEVIKTKEERIIAFGNCIFLNVERNQIKIEFNGNFSNQQNCCEFLENVIRYENIQFGDSQNNVLRIEKIKDLWKLEELLKENKKRLAFIQELFSYLKLDPNQLQFDKLDHQSQVHLEILYNVAYKRKTIGLNVKSQGFNILQVGNFRIGVFIYKIDGEEIFRLRDVFNSLEDINFFATTKQGRTLPVSPYVFLPSEYLHSCDNLDFDIVLEDIKRINLDDDYGNLTNIMGLEMIKLYDKTGDERFLKIAIGINEWIGELTSIKDICTLNVIQINLRLRGLTKEELFKLHEMRDQYIGQNDFRMLFGISILLENKSDVQFYFEKLNYDQQAEFVQYPIYDLAKSKSLI